MQRAFSIGGAVSFGVAALAFIFLLWYTTSTAVMVAAGIVCFAALVLGFILTASVRRSRGEVGSRAEQERVLRGRAQQAERERAGKSG